MFGRLEDKMRKIGDASFSGMRRGENCLRGLSFFVLSSHMDAQIPSNLLPEQEWKPENCGAAASCWLRAEEDSQGQDKNLKDTITNFFLPSYFSFIF